MLQLQVIRQRPDWAKERLAVKHFPEPTVVDTVLELDDGLAFAFDDIIEEKIAIWKEPCSPAIVGSDGGGGTG